MTTEEKIKVLENLLRKYPDGLTSLGNTEHGNAYMGSRHREKDITDLFYHIML